MKKQGLTIFVLVGVFLFSSCQLLDAAGKKTVAPVISLLLKKKSIDDAYSALNTTAKLISVSSGSADQLTVDWLPSSDTTTPHSQMKYTVHASTNEGFDPSATTAKGSIVGGTTLTVNGMQPNTQYFVVISATDTSGNESWSNRLSARTVSTIAVQTSANVVEQEENQHPEITSDTVVYASDTQPDAGDYLVSGLGNGYLRKVTAATSSSGIVTAQTEDASLNEVLESYEISSTVKIAKVPESSGTPTMMKTQAGSVPGREFHWPQSGLTLSDTNPAAGNGSFISSSTGKLIQTASRMDQTVSGQYANITGPEYLAASPGTTTEDTINVSLKNDAASQNREICKIVLEEFSHDDSDLEDLNPPVSHPFIAVDKKTGSLQLSFSPTIDYIDSKNRPYEVSVSVYIDEKGDGCNGDDLLATWDEIKEIQIPVYVTQGRLEVDDEEKIVTFTGDYSVKNEAVLTFEPELNIDLKTSSSTLESADFIARANIRLENTLTINATGAGNLDKTLPLLKPRQFIRVYMLGEVPVVIRGIFSMNARVQGHVGAKATLVKFMDLQFPDTSFGFRYRNGNWQRVDNFTPKFTFTIDGEADADADIALTLIPDLQIHIYEVASGRMLLEPSVYAETELHGQFSYDNEDGFTDLDYWFPSLNAGVSLGMRLYAGMHILDYNIISWPADVSYEQVEQFNFFQLITREQGKMFALPAMEATVDDNPANPPDSRALLVNGATTDYITPLFGWNLNPFRKWTEARVVSDQDYEITPLNETLAQHWFIPKEAGDFTVRLGGHSKLGWFVRQVVETELNLSDADANGLPDYWETRYSLNDAAADEDGDGLSNRQEFEYGTFPQTADSDGDGIDDGQEIADGTDPLDPGSVNRVSTLTVSGGSIQEGDSGSKSINFTFNLNTFFDTASVDYSTLDGTATTADNDYIATSGTVTFNGGSTSETVSVTIQGDSTVEPNETFSMVLANPVNVTLENSSATATIINDDGTTTTATLNDTGITWGGDYPDGNNATCTGEEIGAQDCSHGRDATHNDDSDGHAGFSFTKLDASGNSLPASAASWSCVKDNVTGLVWEVKTDDGGLHDKYDTYSWYNTDPATNGGADGFADYNGDTCYGYNGSDSSTFCNTQAYTARVNAAGWCGATNWRMPSRKELQSIVSYDRRLPSIDTGYFPNTRSSNVWSGSPDAGCPDCVWDVYFGNGTLGYTNRYNGRLVRLVRGGQ